MDHLSLENIFTQIFSKEVKVKNIRNLSGGCINNAVRVETSAGNYFVKYNYRKDILLFETEAKGLALLKKAETLDIPGVHGYGSTSDFIYLILELIEPGRRIKDYWQDFGRSLAQLHKNTGEYYGLDHNNFIGSLPQSNLNNKSWIYFFIEQRLKPQLQLALRSGKADSSILSSFEKLYQKLPALIREEQPALLHGDLWSGNVMINAEGKVALIDPAVYYGHREAEIAFTKLFGGFDEEFYESYQESYPLEKGSEERMDIYNLYPLLVHANLFGGGYLNSVLSTVKRFI